MLFVFVSAVILIVVGIIVSVVIVAVIVGDKNSAIVVMIVRLARSAICDAQLQLCHYALLFAAHSRREQHIRIMSKP